MAFLTPSDHADFVRQGYLILRGAVEGETLARAVEYLERSAPFLTGTGDPKHVNVPELVACTQGRVREAVQEIVGEHLSVEGHLLLHLPREFVKDRERQADLRFGGLHVDPEKPTMMPDTMAMGVMIYLTDVKPRGGGMVFSAGSHIKNRSVMHRGYRGIFEQLWSFHDGRQLLPRSTRRSPPTVRGPQEPAPLHR